MLPDLARFPRFRRAEPRRATLAPGDVVFLPARTWHHVTSEEASISVNFWWARGALAWLYRSGEVLFRHDDDTMAHLKVGLDPSALARFETHYPYRPQ